MGDVVALLGRRSSGNGIRRNSLRRLVLLRRHVCREEVNEACMLKIGEEGYRRNAGACDFGLHLGSCSLAVNCDNMIKYLDYLI